MIFSSGGLILTYRTSGFQLVGFETKMARWPKGTTMAKFPKTLFVKEDRTEGEAFFIADKDILGHAQMGEKITLGVYRLVETQVVEGVIAVSKKRKAA
jgi:coenzyme F420-reducing hydrogenase beta subunit